MTAPRQRDSRASRLPETEQRMPPAVTRARLRTVGALDRARSGPLRYLVLGGAVLGSFAGLVAVPMSGSNEAAPEWIGSVLIFVCMPVGFIAGLTVGWLTFGFVRSRTDPSGTRRLSRTATLLLALPAYLVAGEVGAAVSGFVAGSAPGSIAASTLPITVVLLVGYLMIAPLSFAFARRDRTQPTTFGEALLESRVAMDNPRNPSRTFWAAVFAVLWLFPGSFFVVGFLLQGVEAIAPSVKAVEGLGWAVLVAWLLIGIGGAAAAFWLARQESGWHPSDTEPGPAQPRPVYEGSVYEGPGMETGVIVVPVTILISLAGAVFASIEGEGWHGLIVAPLGLLIGIGTWLGLWELFVRLHPRGAGIKWYVVPFLPLVLEAVVIVALIALL